MWITFGGHTTICVLWGLSITGILLYHSFMILKDLLLDMHKVDLGIGDFTVDRLQMTKNFKNHASESIKNPNSRTNRTIYMHIFTSNQLLDKNERKRGKQIQIKGNEKLIMARIIKNLTTNQIKPNQINCNEENSQTKAQTGPK